MKRPRSGYLPGLDGWRALAILGVILAHDHGIKLGRFGDADFNKYGSYGVLLFFAISGILICTRILEEEKLVGRFHLKSFYIRRVLRIQPASSVYLAAIAVLMVAGVVHESWQYWRGALLFYANFLAHAGERRDAAAFAGHFWTLSIEEHFYILLSLLLFFFRRHRIKIFALLILSIRLWQYMAHKLGYYSADYSGRRTYWVILYLLTPAFLALLLNRRQVREIALKYLQPWVAYLVTLLLMLMDRIPQKLHDGRTLWSLKMFSDQQTYLFFGFSLWVIASMLHPKSWTTQFLEFPPLRYVGRLSYSLYLWHVLFFVPAIPEVGITTPWLLFLSGRPWKYIAAFGMAMFSYYLIEKPFVRLGHRLAPPATPGHKDLDTGRMAAEPVEAAAH